MKKILVVDDVLSWRNFHLKNLNAVYSDNADIDTADSATEAYSKLLENIDAPYDAIITDLQMEEDFSPKYAGEWLIEQIKMLPQYNKARIIIISSTTRIKLIANSFGVNYIPKSPILSPQLYKDMLAL